MNFFQQLISFFPTLIAYLRGALLFREGKYDVAVEKFEKCLNHPKFQNEDLFSYYGQSLCALGNLEEGYVFLINACELYEKANWEFDSEETFNLSISTQSALKHIFRSTNLSEGKDFLERQPLFREG